MPKLPSPESLGGIPSARSGFTVANPDTSALAEGVARFGAQVAAAGAVLGENWQKVQALNTETEFQKFQFEEIKRYNETTRNMQPGEAAGFTQRSAQEYQERAREFSKNHLQNTDPIRHGVYDGKLFDLEKKFFDDAYAFENKEQFRAANASLDDGLNNAILPRAQMAARLPTGDPRKGVLLAEAERDALAMIDANPALTPIEKEERKRKTRQDVQTQFASALPAEERVQVDPGYGSDGTVDLNRAQSAIAGIESGGHYSILGPVLDSGDRAYGKYQVMGANIPSWTKEALGRELTPREFLASEEAQDAVFNHRFGGYVAKYGNVADAASAWFTGRPLAEGANRRDVFGTTGRGYVGKFMAAYGGGQAGSSWGRTLDAVPYEEKLKIAAGGQTDIEKQSTQHYGDVLLGIQTHQITDPNDILNDPDLKPFHKATLFNIWEADNKEQIALSAAAGRVAAGDTFNPYDTEDRKAADAYYGMLGGSEGLVKNEPEATKRLIGTVAQTGIVPQEALAALRGGLDSTDPQTLGGTLGVLAGLYRANPRVFEPYDGGAGLREAASAFVHLTQDRGLSGEEAAQRIAQSRDPERKANAKLLESGADALVKKLSVGDVTNAFDPGVLPWQNDPSAGPTPEAEAALLADYQEIAREKYVESGGDAEIAKAQAVAEMKRLYGVSTATGKPTLMKYPPENYYPPIGGNYEYLKQEAFKDAGSEINPNVKNVFLVSSRETAEDIRAGRIPRYRLFWVSEENGQRVIHESADSLFSFPQDRLKELVAEDKTKQVEEAAKRHKEAIKGQAVQDEMTGNDRKPSPGTLNPQFFIDRWRQGGQTSGMPRVQ